MATEPKAGPGPEPERRGTAGERGYEAEDEGVAPGQAGEVTPPEDPARRAGARSADPFAVRPGGPVPDELRRDPSDDGTEM